MCCSGTVSEWQMLIGRVPDTCCVSFADNCGRNTGVNPIRNEVSCTTYMYVHLIYSIYTVQFVYTDVSKNHVNLCNDLSPAMEH